MRTEALNTFNDGIIQDMYDPQVPASALRNALNATMVTFNGNELALQNDMGNAKIGTAYLPEGYVPVGMKEHGGIVYVASMNPATGKGQIGTFPSPQRVFEPQSSNFANLNFNISELISIEEDVPFLQNDFVRKNLFNTENSLDSKQFSPGDKFTVFLKVSDTILNLLKKGVLNIKLCTISNSGQMHYINNDDLRLFDCGDGLYTWYKCYKASTKNNDGSETLYEDSDKKKPIDKDEFVQVFSGKSPGILSVVIEYNLFDSFNVYRNYSVDSNNKIQLTLTGEATGIPVGIKDDSDNEIKGDQMYISYSLTSNSGDTTPEKSTTTSLTVNESENKVVTYKAYPSCYFGVNELLEKTGTVDFEQLRKNNDKVTGWSQYVTDSFVTINWSYDYFSLDTTQSISKMTFEFIDLQKAGTTEYAQWSETDVGYTKFEFTKDVYSGSFEDSFAFNEGNFRYGGIYVCLVKRWIGDKPTIVHTAYVYNTPLFNTWSPADYESMNGTNRPTVNIHIGVSASVPTIQEDTLIQFARYTDNPQFNQVSSVRNRDLMIIQDGVDEHWEFNTRLLGEYTITQQYKIEEPSTFTVSGKQYSIGKYLAGNIDGIHNSISIKNTEINDTTDNINSMIAGVPSENLEYPQFTSKDKSTNGLETTITGIINRQVIGQSSEVQQKNISIERLLPVYDENDPEYNNNVLFGFKYEGSNIKCITAQEDDCYTDSTITTTGETTNGSKSEGSNHNAYTLACSKMGDKTINIMAGCDGTNASLRSIQCKAGYEKDYAFRYVTAPYFDSIWYGTNAFGRKMIGTGSDTKASPAYHLNTIASCEVDEKDNFMLVSWKCTDNYHRLIPLASQKNTTNRRVDNVIKCILSQLLIAKRSTQKIKYKTVNTNSVSYHKTFDNTVTNTATIQLNKSSINIKYSGQNVDDLINSVNGKLSSNCPKNYIPVLNVTYQNQVTQSYKIGNTLNTQPYIDLYTNVDVVQDFSQYSDSLTSNQRGSIHLGKVQSIEADGVCRLVGNALQGYETIQNWDGRYLFDWSRDEVKTNIEYDATGNVKDSNKLKLLYDLKESLIPSIKYQEQHQQPIPETYKNELLVNIEVGKKIGLVDFNKAEKMDNNDYGDLGKQHLQTLLNKTSDSVDELLEEHDDWYQLWDQGNNDFKNTTFKDKVYTTMEWAQGNDSDGPQMVWFVNFGNKSWHYFCGLGSNAYEDEDQKNPISEPRKASESPVKY